jgi:hypothetical protein
VRPSTPEQRKAQQAQFEEDRAAARVLLGSPGGAALIRYLEASWERRGLGETPEKTAYRVALRDAVETLKDIRQEAGHAA